MKARRAWMYSGTAHAIALIAMCVLPALFVNRMTLGKTYNVQLIGPSAMQVGAVSTPSPQQGTATVTRAEPKPVTKPTKTTQPATKAVPKPKPAMTLPPSRPLRNKIMERLSSTRPEEVAVSTPSVSPLSSLSSPSMPAGGFPSGATGGVSAVGLSGGQFAFPWYLAVLHNKIKGTWAQPSTAIAKRKGVLVAFTIHRDGSFEGLRVEESSGNPLFDRSAVAAVENAKPLPPLPDEFKEEALRVAIRFDVEGGV